MINILLVLLTDVLDPNCDQILQNAILRQRECRFSIVRVQLALSLELLLNTCLIFNRLTFELLVDGPLLECLEAV